MNRPLVLVGFMASGKSVLAPLLAERLGVDARDSDHELAKNKGTSIAAWIRDEGIFPFRVAEQQWFEKTFKCVSKPVIAAGGGAFTQRSIRSLCRKNATTVWLDVPLRILKERLNSDFSRPLWPSNRIQQQVLFANRSAVYKLADVRVESATGDWDVGQILRTIKEQMPRHH